MTRLTCHWSTNGTELHHGTDPNQCADCRANRRYPCCTHCAPEHHTVIPANEHTLPCTTCQGHVA